MSDQQQPPYPGPYGQPPSGQQPPYPGPPAQPQSQPGQYGGYGQPPAYGQQQAPPGQYQQQPQYQQGYAAYGQQYPAYPGYHSTQSGPDSTAKMIGWLIAASALIVGIAACLTWASVDLGPRSFTVNGVTGSDIPGDDETTDGIFTLIIAIAVLAFGVVRAIGPLQLTTAIIGTVAGALVALIGIIDIADIQDKKDELQAFTANVEVSIGIGLWLTLLGGILMAAVSVVGIIKHR